MKHYARTLRDIADSDAMFGSYFRCSLETIANELDKSVLLPLDPAQFDAAVVEAVAISLYHALERGGEPVDESWADLDAATQSMYRNDFRAALAAYTRTVGGGA